MGLRTCAALCANGSHTFRCELEFLSFLHEHKENWMCRVSFSCTECPLLTSGSRKINQPCAKYVPYANGTVRKWYARVYKVLDNPASDTRTCSLRRSVFSKVQMTQALIGEAKEPADRSTTGGTVTTKDLFIYVEVRSVLFLKDPLTQKSILLSF